MRWNIDPVLVDLGFEIRWYGLFFALGLALGITTLTRSFEQRGLDRKHASALSLWLPVGMLVGAHLIHLIFYEPRSFIENPVRILELGSGLSSHGGGIGSVGALYLFCRAKKVSFHRYADAGIIGAAWIIPFVRIGNFFNSEIVGRKTDVPWAVIFERVDEHPRHPSQLYEAALGFILVGMALWAHRRRASLKPGVVFYALLAYYFTTRFLIEWVKEYQALAPDFPFTMGQLLSVPMIAGCVLMAVRQSRQPVEPLLTPAADRASAPRARHTPKGGGGKKRKKRR